MGKHTHNPSKQTTQTIKMETIKNAANYVAESVQGGGAQASKEANKQVAKDGDAGVGTRASAANDAVSDKIDQSSHEGKADLHMRLLSTKLLATNKQTYLTTVRLWMEWRHDFF